jgi:glyoxylase-like metal-dependent hydrolase (beta-lactamase superfamily II)
MSNASPDASLTADESYTKTSVAGLTYPWGKAAPGVGEIMRVGDGVSWARLPMPGSLGHINSWLLDDGDHLVAVDTGLQLASCSDAWKALFAGALKDRPLSKILCTHLHPDHIGLAGWLCKRFDAPLLMTRGEWLTARMLMGDIRDAPPSEATAMHRAAGWSEEQVTLETEKGWGRFASVIFPLPVSYRRIQDGEIHHFGKHKWRVVVGSGHSPEHACLWNEEAGVLISGDQVLPRISSNVSVNVSEPTANPLKEWLDSIDKLLSILPDDVLVCPAHGEPFYGLHTRLKALRDEHLARLDALSDAMKTPMRVVDSFSLLFNRQINDNNRGMATGEAFSHLRYLENAGRAVCEPQDGVNWYRAL